MRSLNVIPMSARLLGRIAIAAALLATGAVRADQSSETSQGAGALRLQKLDPTSFIKEASEANQSEVALGELAQSKTQNPAVKRFAEMMVRDHSQNNQQLQPLAASHSVTVPTTLDAKQQKEQSRLEQLSGSQFDQEYVKLMLRDHQKDIAKFEKASQIDDPQVKQYVQTTLPTLRQHLQHAKRTAQVIGIDDDTVSSILKEHDSMGGSEMNSEKESGSSQGAGARQNQMNQDLTPKP